MARQAQQIYICEDSGASDGILLFGTVLSGGTGEFSELILETTAAIFLVPGTAVDIYRVEWIEEFFDA